MRNGAGARQQQRHHHHRRPACEISRDRRAEDEQGRRDARSRVYDQAISEVVATRKVGVGNWSDPLACRKFDGGHVEARASDQAIDGDGNGQ